MPLNPGTKLGPYEILGPIGAGGMGEVYRARDERLSRDVAVKVLPSSFLADPERLRRFEQEARSTGQLNHPNILAVHDTGSHEGAPYVVAELLEGETLRRKLSGSPLPARKAIDYAGQVARGLAAAHQKGIVHRDLKPENLFVTDDGRVKILDFGLAKLLVPETGGSSMTEAPTLVETGAGVVVGTVGYMSPEQVRGQPLDHRSDIFSFGSILYEMVTGHRAFQAGSSVETMNAILKEEPPEVSRSNQDLPPGLDRIVQHCMEKSPEERFQSARDLAFQIEALSSHSAAVAAHAADAAPALVPRALRARPAIALAVILAAFALGVIADKLSRRAPDAVTYSQLTFRKGSISSARFTPDGESVVYSAAWDGGPVELFSTRPGSPESRPLGMASAEILSVSASGEMALLLDPHFTLGFQRTGTLARAPLAGGVPRQVLGDVQDADWSPDGQGFAVARAVEGRYRLEYPIGKVLYETEHWLSTPRFSRDGKRIGFIDHPLTGDNRGRVAVVDLSGNMKPLTEPFSAAEGLAWSPSGDEIWFTAGKTGNVQALYAVDLSSAQRIVDGAPASLGLQDVSPAGRILLTRSDGRRGMIGLAPDEETERDLSWLDWSRPSALSADGHWLLFEEQGQGGGPDYSVYLRKTDGSPAVKLGEGYSLALSPDGQWAATVPVDDPHRIVIVSRGAGQARTLTLDLSVRRARWLPDGERLLINGSEAGHLPRLFLVDLRGGAPRPITPEGVVFDGALSRDGESFAAAIEGGEAKIYSVNGGEPRPIPGIGKDDKILSWSGDGRSLFVARTRELPVRIQRLDLATGQKHPWKNLMPFDSAGLLDIGFIQLSEDGQSYVFSFRRILSTLYLAQGLS